MSAGQPPSYTPPPPSGTPAGYPPPAPPPQPARTGFFGQFRGMSWWEVVLVVLPLTLIIVGGLIGGVCGALGAIANTYIARSTMSSAVKILAMLGVLVAAYVVYFIVAIAVFTAINRAGS